MTLTDEMRRLTQRLGEDHNVRTAAVVGIRAIVAQNMSEFRANRQTEAEAQRQRLMTYMNDLDAQMAKARSDTAALLAGLVVARGNMSKEQQGKLAEDLGAMRESTSDFLDEWTSMLRALAHEQQERLSAHVDVLRKDMVALRDRLEAANQTMAQDQRKSLSSYMSDMLNQVDQMLKDADQAMSAQRSALQNMAIEQRQQLTTENQLLKDEVKLFTTRLEAELQSMAAEQQLQLSTENQLLKDEVSLFIARLEAERRSMAIEQRQQLTTGNQLLKDEVNLFTVQIGAARQQLSADQAGARQVWASYSSMIRQGGASPVQETAQTPAEPALEKKK